MIATQQMILGTTAASAPSPLLTGLVNYWKLDETSGIRYDSIGTNNLTVEENGPIGSATGKVGNAASFVAASQQALRAATAVLVHNAISVSLWFKATSFPPDYTNPFSMRYPSGNDCFELYVNPFKQVAVYMASGVVTTSLDGVGPTVFTTGQWYHYAATYDNTTGLQTYVNGAPEWGAAPVGSLGTLSLPLAIGREMYALQRWHNGLIDEVGIWERALTAANITTLYNGGAGMTLP